MRVRRHLRFRGPEPTRGRKSGVIIFLSKWDRVTASVAPNDDVSTPTPLDDFDRLVKGESLVEGSVP